jgi:hypothetical protein
MAYPILHHSYTLIPHSLELAGETPALPGIELTARGGFPSISRSDYSPQCAGVGREKTCRDRRHRRDRSVGRQSIHCGGERA